MTIIDLKDAFLTVPMHEPHQKYFKFEWIDKYISLLECQMGILMR